GGGKFARRTRAHRCQNDRHIDTQKITKGRFQHCIVSRCLTASLTAHWTRQPEAARAAVRAIRCPRRRARMLTERGPGSLRPAPLADDLKRLFGLLNASR